MHDSKPFATFTGWIGFTFFKLIFVEANCFIGDVMNEYTLLWCRCFYVIHEVSITACSIGCPIAFAVQRHPLAAPLAAVWIGTRIGTTGTSKLRMFAVERWNGQLEGKDDAGRRDGSRTPQFAALTRAQLPPAPAGSAARGVGRTDYRMRCGNMGLHRDIRGKVSVHDFTLLRLS
jgi:hypothetical protein